MQLILDQINVHDVYKTIKNNIKEYFISLRDIFQIVLTFGESFHVVLPCGVISAGRRVCPFSVEPESYKMSFSGEAR
jgi:hypothetical protein